MIENRPISDFELNCIVEAQMRLRNDPSYMKIIEEIDEAEKALQRSEELNKLKMLQYEFGFWNGEMFNIVKREKAEKIMQEQE